MQLSDEDEVRHVVGSGKRNVIIKSKNDMYAIVCTGDGIFVSYDKCSRPVSSPEAALELVHKLMREKAEGIYGIDERQGKLYDEGY